MSDIHTNYVIKCYKLTDTKPKKELDNILEAYNLEVHFMDEYAPEEYREKTIKYLTQSYINIIDSFNSN